jgi:glycine oxidase
MARYDVTIMGAGVFGLSLAYVCALRGARVQVMEARALGAGSSGGIVGALAPHVPENWNAKKDVQLQALRMAPDFWAGVAAQSGIDPGYARNGRVQPVPERKLDLAQARADGARALWKGAGDWHVLPVDQAPGLPLVSPSGHVIYDTLTARLHPRQAGRALLGAVQALGGSFVIGDTPPDGPVVWATGYQGLEALGADLGRPMGTGVKGQAVLLRYAAPDAPQLFVDGLHIVPHRDGTVAVGSTSERDFTDPASTDSQCDTLIARAVAACPALAGAPVLERWAGVRPRATSRAPLMGAWPARDGHFVFNGGFKIGFAMAPYLAQIMADLVLDGVDRIPDGFGLDAV